MIRKWLNGHLTSVLTTALALVLSAAAIGSWNLVFELREWQKMMEVEHAQYGHGLTNNRREIDSIKRRIRWLERNRTVLTIWDGP